MSMNITIVIGNLTRDPELRYLPSGTAIVAMGLAVNESWKDSTGAKQEYCSFFDVDVFGGQAEAVNKHLQKGAKIAVHGRLKQERWQDRQTNTARSKVKIIAERVEFLGGRGSQEEEGSNGHGGQAPSGRQGGPPDRQRPSANAAARDTSPVTRPGVPTNNGGQPPQQTNSPPRALPSSSGSSYSGQNKATAAAPAGQPYSDSDEHFKDEDIPF